MSPPLDRLSDEELAKIDFVISYADGAGTKVYLFGIANDDARDLFLKIRALSQ